MTAQTLEDVVVNPPVKKVPCPMCLRVIPLFEAVDVRDVDNAINANAFVCGACLHEEIRQGRMDRAALTLSLTAAAAPASANVQLTVPITGPTL